MSEEIIWTPERKELALKSCEKWRGTPHKNRMSVLGVGIDCIKFVNEVLADSGIIDLQQFGGYDIQEGMFGVSDVLKKAVENSLHCERVDVSKNQFGDIAVFRNGMMAGHCGFLDETHIWHSLAGHFVTRSGYRLWNHDIEFLFRITKTGLKRSAQAAIDLI